MIVAIKVVINLFLQNYVIDLCLNISAFKG